MGVDEIIEWDLKTIGGLLMQIKNEMSTHNTQMQQMQSRLDTSEAKITKLENELDDLKVTLEREFKERDNFMNGIEQSTLKNGILLRGFNYSFNEENVVENFTRAIKSDLPLVSSHKFTVDIMKNGKARKIFFLKIIFSCFNDKKKAISYVTTNGCFRCEELDDNCPPEELENAILIDDVLTKINLQVKKTLLKARSKMEKGDFLLRMKGKFFQAKLKGYKNWTMVPNIIEANKILSEVMRSIQPKRNRISPQDPATTPTTKRIK